MKKLVIAVDCDDVLVPTGPLILQHYNKTYGTHLELKDYYLNNLGMWNAPDAATAVQRVEAYTKTAEHQNIEPFAEALAVLRKLRKYHELHVITGRADSLQIATTDMLKRHFPDIFQTIEFTNFFGHKARAKSDVCRELNVDYLIDDHLHHATTVADCGTNVLLFGDYPWNQAEQLPANVRRVKDWHEVKHVLLRD